MHAIRTDQFWAETRKQEENLEAEEINMSKDMKTVGYFLAVVVLSVYLRRIINWGGFEQVLLVSSNSFAFQYMAED